MKIESVIKENLQSVFKDWENIDIKLEVPEDPKNGDLTTNIAMILFGKLDNKDKVKILGDKVNPRALAEYIVSKSNFTGVEGISKVEVAGPGFINIYLEDAVYIDELNQILEQGEKYGSNNSQLGQKVVVEYTDPNPFKVFHIGHLFPNIIGECLANLFEFEGADVRRVSYQGDVGMHVSKAVYGIAVSLEEDEMSMDDLGKKPLEERIQYMGKAYAKGATAFEDDDIAKKRIEKLNMQIYKIAQSFLAESGWEVQSNYGSGREVEEVFPNEIIEKIYRLGRQWSLEGFELIYKRLGTKFDDYYFEVKAADKGYQIVKHNIDKGIFQVDKGAVIFKGDEYGLHTRVFINSNDLPTYESKDLALTQLKYDDSPYDRSIIVTGNEINEYFKVVLKALSLINSDLAKKTTHLGHGMMDLKSGKMSSRTGNVIGGEWLLDLTVEEVKRMIKDSKKLDPDIDIDEISETVGLGAAKYMILKPAMGNGIKFDFEESISFEGNSSAYIQYTNARAISVLNKSSVEADKVANTTILNDREKELIKLLLEFPDHVERALESLSPHYVCHYIYLVTQNFNSFYNSNKVIGDEKENLRIGITKASSNVIEKGLNLLGITAPQRM